MKFCKGREGARGPVICWLGPDFAKLAALMPKDLAMMVPCPVCGERHPQDVLNCPKDGSLLPLEGRLLAGKFRLLSALGRGGMSTVWRAENALVRKRVAIKLMLPELLGNPQTLQRFRNEATAAGRIGNRHICDILDFGESKAGPFIVMEMLRGQDLGRLIEARGRLSPGLAVWIVRQALLGLQAAHEAGIIHRDLKPENVFLHEPAPGQILVKLMDFGISKFSEVGSLSKTATGIIMGTPGYMSPEQIQGAANADERADLWAMGVMLYASILGEEPFVGDSFAKVLMAVTSTEPTPIEERLPGIDPKLAQVIHRCLHKDPSKRFASCNALAAALAPFEAPVDATELQIGHGPNAKLPKETPQELTVPDRVEVRADVGEAPQKKADWEGEVVPTPANLDALGTHPAQAFVTQGPREGLGLDTGATVGPKGGLNPDAMSLDAKRNGTWSGALQGSGENATRWSMGKGAQGARTWGGQRSLEQGSNLRALAVLSGAVLLVGAMVGGGYYAYQHWNDAEAEAMAQADAAKQGGGASSEQGTGAPASDASNEEVSEANKPEANQPEANKPEANKPEANKPEANKPEANKPEANKPEANKPEANKPDTDKPKKAEPGDNQGEEKKPEADKPKAKPKRPQRPKTTPQKPKPQRPKSSGAPANVDKTKVKKIAGYYVPSSNPPNRSHAQAQAHCASLRRNRFAGLREWQLPSASWLLGRIGALKPTRYWSKSRGTRAAKAADLGFGRKVIDDDPNKKYRALCVARR